MPVRFSFTACGALITLLGTVWLAGCHRSSVESPQAAGTESATEEVNPPVNPPVNSPVSTPDDDESRRAEKLTSLFPPDEYAGTDSCRACHPKQYESYRLTHHSRSMARSSSVDTPTKSAGFTHAKSRTRFDVENQDGTTVHRQTIVFADDEGKSRGELRVSELPVEWVIGSGAFAKGYLLQADEFLVQSPVTWYAKPNEYAMAPGYDERVHLGTTRVVGEQCLYCHVGSFSLLDRNDEKVVVDEAAINCERCHGPGKAHASAFTSYQESVDAGSDDATQKPHESLIANPASLDRMASESVCAQCHLQGDVIIERQGRSMFDFRPGESLGDTRVAFAVDVSESDDAPQKSFVEHFDQMWHSACYIESSSLTCVTCHDPHRGHTDRPLPAVYTQQCLKCHSDESCRLEMGVRMDREQNHCYRCHMPRMDSEVPHTATTNHRIAVYPLDGLSMTPPGNEVVSSSKSSELRPLFSPHDPMWSETQAKSQLERAKRIAMTKAHIQLPKGKGLPTTPRRSLDSLLELWNEAKQDVALDHVIAHQAKSIAESTDVTADEKVRLWGLVKVHARRVIEGEPRMNSLRKEAFELLSSAEYESGDWFESIRHGLEVATSRRMARDWYNLGITFGRIQRYADAEQALRQATQIDATYSPPYRSLFRLYQQTNPPLAERVRATGMLLEQHLAAPR